MKILKLFFLAFIILTSGLFFVSCENNNTTKEKIEEAGEDISDVFRTEQQELRADIEEVQRDIQSEIDEIEADMENTSEETSEELQKQLDKLNMWKEDLDNQMKRLNEKADEGWVDFKTDLHQTLDDINRELKDTFEKKEG